MTLRTESNFSPAVLADVAVSAYEKGKLELMMELGEVQRARDNFSRHNERLLRVERAARELERATAGRLDSNTGTYPVPADLILRLRDALQGGRR